MNPSPTVKQALHFFTLVEQKGTPDDHLQALYQSGLVSDLLDANVLEIDRDEFRRVCGLRPLVPELTIWKTIRLGVHKTPEAYEQALESKDRISDYARQILKKISVSQTEIELDLVAVAPADLGLKNPTYQQICDRAIGLGLEKCPREVGPALRLNYPDQPYGEWLLVAMEPEADSGGRLHVFGVGDGDDGLWLRTGWFSPRYAWSGGGQFVFVRPRK